MAELLTFSQYSLLLLPKCQLQYSKRVWNPCTHYMASPTKLMLSTKLLAVKKKFFGRIRSNVISDSKMPACATFTVDPAVERVDVLPNTGGGDDVGNTSGKGGGGGGGNNGGDSNHHKEGGGESGENKDQNAESSKKTTGISMSQKLTLGYAILVGAAAVMGYLITGSQKSLIASGLSASLLYYVYTALPTKPVFASSLGFVLSVVLLGVMGSRFKSSGKIFPAGVISFASLIMSIDYLHGFMHVTP